MTVKIGTALVKPRHRTTQEAAAEIQRELDVRKRCFDRWVADGKVSEIDAVDRYERLYTAGVLLQSHLEREQDQEAAK